MSGEELSSSNKRSIYFYIDMDAFFASVEEAEHPEFVGKPMAVAGRSASGGVISCANYTARKLGVKSAIPVFKAKKICPELILVPGSMQLYKDYSVRVMELLSSYTPDFYQISIDEAWMDMSGMGKMYRTVKECALDISKNVREKIGLSCSIGVAWDLVIAKMASDYKKPGGITVIPCGQEEVFIDSCGIDKLWGVGKFSHEMLRSRNIDTVAKLRAYELIDLKNIFGDVRGEYLYNVVRGKAGERKVEQDKKRKSHSISTERTFDDPTSDKKVLDKKIEEYSFKLFSQCLDEKIYPRTVSIKIKYTYDKFITASITTKSSHYFNSRQVSNAAKELFHKKHIGECVRLIGVELSNFITAMEAQTLLGFMDDDSIVKLSRMDSIANLFSKAGLDIKPGAIYNFD